MYCQYCGVQLDDAALYCGRCGKSTAPNPSSAPNADVPPSSTHVSPSVAPVPKVQWSIDPMQVLSRNVQVLGILWPVYGVFRLVLTAWGIFTGRMMPRIWIRTWPPQVNPYRFAPIMHGIVVAAIVWSVVISLFGIWVGLALLARARSGRTIAVVAAFLSLISIPFGTALGVYTLVVLLPEGASRDYMRLVSSS